MKAPDHERKLHMDGTEKPGIQKTLDCDDNRECHGHHDLAGGYGAWGSHLGFGSYDSRSKLHFALGGGSIPRKSGPGAPAFDQCCRSKRSHPDSTHRRIGRRLNGWEKMMNNIHRENGTMAGPLIFTVPAYGFVMALYLDCLGRTQTRERLPITGVENTRKRRSGFEWPT